MRRLARGLAKSPLRALLAWPGFRRRAIYELRRRYYPELHNSIGLGHGLQCPLLFADAWASFGETFIHREYEPAFDRVPLPARWLDLGCHAGFFSLYVAWRRAGGGLADRGEALLVDGDARMQAAVDGLIAVNGLQPRFRFALGLVAPGGGMRAFRQRDVMASSVATLGDETGVTTQVPVLTPGRLLRLFPPPYDLIKLDVEGSEHAFVTDYGPVLERAGAVLLEWHSWHEGGGGGAQIREALAARGFDRVVTVRERQVVADRRLAGASTGLDLCLRGRPRR